ncbi:MAG: HesA/MoeB/ThiF family protein [Gammaproteobacteria bacterium]|nr:HesA/MoeB/ThiF family protein [Gammaproteobacteria bacterium]MYF02971.1 HesA/MoeB/ThiF family protein [Gammaproteobacteria bacterium]MYI76722.1 HesA/MoeB/ThiF family protein [Gammaproteobacteria bacterium]
MDDKQLLRYSRQIMLTEIDVLGQEKINSSHVAIIGLGGLGCPVAMYLAASGVGKLTLVDDDLVELSNLQRQIAHTEDSIGDAKVDVVRRTVRGLNSQTKVTTVQMRVDSIELENLLPDVDVIVDATDNFEVRFAINEVSRKFSLPLVSGAAIRMEGQVMVLDPRNAESPCYRCLYPSPSTEPQNCAENGIFAPLVGVIGALQALETLKMICELSHDSIGWVHYFDAKSMEWRKLGLKRNPSCPECGK